MSQSFLNMLDSVLQRHVTEIIASIQVFRHLNPLITWNGHLPMWIIISAPYPCVLRSFTDFIEQFLAEEAVVNYYSLYLASITGLENWSYFMRILLSLTSDPDKNLNSRKTFLEVYWSPEPNGRDWKAWKPLGYDFQGAYSFLKKLLHSCIPLC